MAIPPSIVHYRSAIGFYTRPGSSGCVRPNPELHPANHCPVKSNLRLVSLDTHVTLAASVTKIL